MKNLIFVAKFCILTNKQSVLCLLLSTFIPLVSLIYTYVKLYLRKTSCFDMEELFLSLKSTIWGKIGLTDINLSTLHTQVQNQACLVTLKVHYMVYSSYLSMFWSVKFSLPIAWS